MDIIVNGKPFDAQGIHSAKEIAEKLHLNGPDQALGVKINGVPRDLDTPVQSGDRVDFISFDDPLGKEIFWHTSAHVLAQAILRLFPNAKPTIGPPIEQGFYYDFADLTISDADFEKIENEAQKIIEENYVTKRHVLKDKADAKARFKTNPIKF